MNKELLNVLIAQYQTKTDDVRLKQQEIAGIYGFSVAAILVLLGLSIQQPKSAIICFVPVVYIFSVFLANVRLYEIHYLRKYIDHLQNEITRLLGIVNIFQQTSSSFFVDKRIRVEAEKSPLLLAASYVLYLGLFISIYIVSLIRATIVLYRISTMLGMTYLFLMIIFPMVIGIAFLKGKKLLDSIKFNTINQLTSTSDPPCS